MGVTLPFFFFLKAKEDELVYKTTIALMLILGLSTVPAALALQDTENVNLSTVDSSTYVIETFTSRSVSSLNGTGPVSTEYRYPIPPDKYGEQSVTYEFSPEPNTSSGDNGTFLWRENLFEGDELSVQGRMTVVVDRVECSTDRDQYDDIDGISDLDVDDRWSGTEELNGREWEILEGEFAIDTEATDIRKTAEDLRKDDDNSLEVLTNLYRHLSKYDYERDRCFPPDPARITLNLETFDCDEASWLFSSLARCVGIPTRPVYGYLYDSTTNSLIDHTWCESLLPLRGCDEWVIFPVDVVNNQFGEKDTRYIKTWEYDGNGTNLELQYRTWTYNTSSEAMLVKKDQVSVSYLYSVMMDRIHPNEVTSKWPDNESKEERIAIIPIGPCENDVDDGDHWLVMVTVAVSVINLGIILFGMVRISYIMSSSELGKPRRAGGGGLAQARKGVGRCGTTPHNLQVSKQISLRNPYPFPSLKNPHEKINVDAMEKETT